ncbi:hypothetical protein [Glycomyces harbinensis]|uniref:Uncharacterized protein n=1 Tax=Glycomyces harbinensis TaxID=58114 RepID=A0A1G6Y621_9ACTN|nr:hypothetical protein [Glycomyces harbinensis]SDD85045.1 hypothetical protein SAMN05216270_108119 [Glycomyces harbinensis]
MPRRPPARVRAQQPRRLSPWRATFLPRIPGASGALQAAVVRLEHADARLTPGDIAQAFTQWRRWVHRPVRQLSTGAGSCPCPSCGTWSREVLERTAHRLPPRQARELRRLLEPLDERFLSRTVPVPARFEHRWWAYRA